MHAPIERGQSGTRGATTWDLLVRTSGLSLAIVLAIAYATGEEYPHTHMLIAYGFAAVVVANLYWELIRPRAQHAGHSGMPHRVAVLLRAAVSWPQAIGPALAAMLVALLLAVLAAAALLLMVLTHTFWPAVAVDEMHEVVAYFALGLVVVHVATVLIASSEHLERRLAALAGRKA